MKKHNFLYVSILLFVIGIIVVVVGINILSKGSAIEVPEMSHPEWFELSTERTQKVGLGSFLTIAGGMIVLSAAVTMLGSKYFHKKASSIVDMHKIAEEVSASLANEATLKNPVVECSYCGTKYPKETHKCPSCGAKESK